jgi:hypothetical protein
MESAAIQEQRRTFWEEELPGSGTAIQGICQRFDGWNMSIRVDWKQMEALAREAIFWCDFRGVQMYDDTARYRDPTLCAVPLYRSFGAVYQPVLNATGLWTEEKEKKLHNGLAAVMAPVYFARFQAEFFESIFMPCALVICRKWSDAAKFDALHRLWLAGYYPNGFDHKGYLLIEPIKQPDEKRISA